MSKLPFTVTVVDGGLFQPLAHRLAKEFQTVYYYRESRDSFPMPEATAIGHGYEDIIRTKSIARVKHETDLFVFPDLYWEDEQAELRSEGKMVFGCGWGERLELYRCDCMEQLERAKLPVIPYEMVTGMKALREYLEDKEDKYIKVSYYRGLMETWRWINQRVSKPRLDWLEFRLSALSEDIEFMVQDGMEAKREIGSDQIVVDGKFPKTVQFAVEGKDKTGLARMIRHSDLPKEVQQVNAALEGILDFQGQKGEQWNPYRGFFSSEIRIGAKDGKPYFTDPTCRCASPCGETYMLMCDNIGEMILEAAQGRILEPKNENTFAAQAIITADLAETMSIPIFIDPKVRDMVCLYHSGIRMDGQECVYKTDSEMLEIGSVIGVGKTIDEAIKRCQENASKIEGDKIAIYTDNLSEFKGDLKP